ncbi:hypothetical protein RFI_09020, partial [Reticulomyxa filosa]
KVIREPIEKRQVHENSGDTLELTAVDKRRVHRVIKRSQHSKLLKQADKSLERQSFETDLVQEKIMTDESDMESMEEQRQDSKPEKREQQEQEQEQDHEQQLKEIVQSRQSFNRDQ